MKNTISEEDVLSLEDILGIGNKFKTICDKLNIKMPRSANSKKSILAQLRQYCDIEEIKEEGKQSKYIINQIYKTPLLSEINKNNKFQPYIEQAIIELALSNNQNILYLSNSAILEATYMVNDNFKIACSSAMNDIEERAWIKKEANEIYSILYTWIRSRLKQMDARHLIQLQKGYRLYKTIKGKDNKDYVVFKDVAKMTEEDKICQNIFANAVAKTKSIPKDWDGGWLHPTVYEELKRNANNICLNTFAAQGEQWERIGIVNVIIPVKDKELLIKRYKDIDKILNNESKRKIKSTSRLDHLTGFQRKQITEEIIELHPQIDYKQLLEKENDRYL